MLIATRKSENDLCRLVSLAALCIDNNNDSVQSAVKFQRDSK